VPISREVREQLEAAQLTRGDLGFGEVLLPLCCAAHVLSELVDSGFSVWAKGEIVTDPGLVPWAC
jgi:hypothetical protein